MVDRIVLHAENGRDDSFWDEKLAIRDKAACRISSEGCLGIAKEDFEKFRGQIVKATTKRTACGNRNANDDVRHTTVCKDTRYLDERMVTPGWKDVGITPSRDLADRYQGPSKDCFFDGVGRQPIPKGLSGERDHDDGEKQNEDDIRGCSGGGRNPQDGDDNELTHRSNLIMFQPPALLAAPKRVLNSTSDVTSHAVFTKLRRLEHRQVEYLPIYGNRFRQQLLRTEHHCSWSAKIDSTHEDRPIIWPQQTYEHYSWLPEAMELRQSWVNKQRWRRLGKNIIGYRI